MVTAINELKTYNNWIGWKTVRKKNMNGDLKDTKVPIDPRTGNYAATDNPETWSDFETAKQARQQYRLDGLGFVFTKEVGIIGIDLDKCVNPNGTLEEWASDIVTKLNSYTELSPSGSGLHILVKGLIPHSIKRDKTGIEIYDSLRYFTITGKHWQESPKEINKNQEGLTAVFNMYKRIAPPEPVVTQRKIYNSNEIPSTELVAELLSYVPRQTEYNDWLKILMAVHDVYPDSTGISLIENWSPGYEGEVANKFRSFRNGTRVSISTLFYYAKEYGWQTTNYSDNNVDVRFAHLPEHDRKEIKAYGWEQYHAGMREYERRIWFERTGFEKGILDMYNFGFANRKVDTETGEVIIGDSLTVPFKDIDNRVINVEYRDLNYDISYDNDYPFLFSTDKFNERQDCQMIVLPDSLTAVNAYLRLVGDYNFVGLPHMPILKETIDYDGAVVLLEPDTDEGEYGLKAVRGHCRFLRLKKPMIELITNGLTSVELGWYIKQAERK